jgi:2-polyprenyl-6-methoxyphenol hydroxylase-like FAD-dependent oxidoreductase
MSTTETKPVLIAGAGPTGMTAAMELSRFGIPVRLIDKAPEPATTSRAIGVQARTLELFEQRGIAAEMLGIGNRAIAASFFGGGKRVFRLEFSHADSRYPFVLLISQAETERILREQLARQGVQIERPVELIALAQKDHAGHSGQAGGVSATLRHKDGSLEELEASYLISAEGAHSIVRSTVGLEFQGKSLDEDFILGDFAIDGGLAETDLQIFSSEKGFIAMFPMGSHRWRLVGDNPQSDPTKGGGPSLEELQEIYDARSHIPAKFRDLNWSSYFRVNSRMVDRLQRECVFLGGDSAHIHSPAGAQGMNTGMQDMINLCWKLALVLQGIASPDLLDTYGEDRLPVIRGVLSNTERLTDVASSESHVFRTVFNHVAPLIVGTEMVQEKGATQMSQVGLNYRSSSLSENHSHHGILRAGDRMPDLSVARGNPAKGEPGAAETIRLYSLFDPSAFTLLYVDAGNDELPAEGESKLAAWQGLIRSHRIAAPGEDEAARKHFAGQLGDAPLIVLVRPDSYIGFIGGLNALPKLEAYLRKWLTP